MHLGVVLTHSLIGTDPGALRTFAREVEDAGYHHLLSSEHVVGANPDAPGFDGGYDYRNLFHEPLTAFSHLAAVTDDLRFVTGIMVLPQRQTVLVAKQAAEVDVLSGGRLDLGVAVGWNDVEYESLGVDFHTRGARIDEQIDLLKRLWTNDLVEFDGRFHHVPDAGINPRPIQQPIPVWIGGEADVVLRRAARVGEGWIPAGAWSQPDQPLDPLADPLDDLHGYLREEGRDPDTFGVHGRMILDGTNPERWVEHARAWHDLGATHLSVNTGSLSLASVDEHTTILGEVHDRLSEAGLDD